MKIMRKIWKFWKDQQFGSGNAETTKILSFYDLIKNAIKIFAVAKLPQPLELLKSLNDHILLKFKEPKEPIQFELLYVD